MSKDVKIEEEKLVNSIMKDDNVKALDYLQKILIKKCSDRIESVQR